MAAAQGETSQNGKPSADGASDDAILIGLGANLPSVHGSPRETLEAALIRLLAAEVRVVARSRWWRSRPVPVSDQPWFVNGVAAIASDLPPDRLLALLHRIEAEFGRVRQKANEARLLDLDLLAHGRLISERADLALPHPRLAQRGFVLHPLREIAPDWVHPATGQKLSAMIENLGSDQMVEPL